MMLVSMVHRSKEKQQETLWARVKVLRGERLKMEYQMWLSWKPLEVFIKNRLLEGRKQDVRVEHGERSLRSPYAMAGIRN